VTRQELRKWVEKGIFGTYESAVGKKQSDRESRCTKATTETNEACVCWVALGSGVDADASVGRVHVINGIRAFASL